MIEIKGDMWHTTLAPEHTLVRCITTNATTTYSGKVVMGRGCAQEAAIKMPELPKMIGDFVREMGNVIMGPVQVKTSRLKIPYYYISTFPVKHNWWEVADLKLIKESTLRLLEIATERKNLTFILPRPGCGNGRLLWSDVLPIVQILPHNVKVITLK